MVAVRRTPPKAVTFDFWNTLIRGRTPALRDRRVDAWLGAARGRGHRPRAGRGCASAVGESLAARSSPHWRRNHDVRRGRRGRRRARPARARRRRRPCATRCWTSSPTRRRSTTRAPTEHIERLPRTPARRPASASASSATSGLTPSTTLRRFLDGHGLLGYFDHWSFSDEVGMFKPDPAIFHHALDGLGGVEPRGRRSRRATSAAPTSPGRRALGITAVRYTGVFDDPGKADDGTADVEADVVLADHADLATRSGSDRPARGSRRLSRSCRLRRRAARPLAAAP